MRWSARFDGCRPIPAYSPAMSKHPLASVRSLAVALALAFSLAACGGSETATTETETTVATDAPATAGGTDEGESPIAVGEDGEVELSDDVEAAVDSVGFEGIVELAAEQLSPQPSDVVVEGNDATLTFAEGSADADSWLPCSVLKAFLEDGQTVTVVYPDGEALC